MSASTLSLPLELVSTWSHWRPTKSQAPLTPPLSTIPQTRVLVSHQQTPTVLPPISYFDRSISRHSPITPPHADDYGNSNKYDYRFPPVLAPTPRSLEPSPSSSQYDLPEDSFAAALNSLDWFGSDSHRSARFIAEKTCEMICYLWFSTVSNSSTSASPSKRNRSAASQHASFSPHSNSSTAKLQFSVSPAFIRFMQKVLETTQVSQSVIVLSLHYIFRLKASNPFTSGQAGSEYRVAIAALMLANKFVDDNTYTNKTWSEVSGIDLAEVNRMEREFLLGIDFDLYVNKPTYDSWLNLLTGLVLHKEKDSQHAQLTQSRASSHRARSSSPRRASICTVSHSAPAFHPSHSQHYTPGPPPPPQLVPLPVAPYPSPVRSAIPAGCKRTAADAFSPTTASFPGVQPPAQVPRRMHGLSLEIPQSSARAHSRESSVSPLESLQSFSKLSLGASPVDNGSAQPWPAVRHEEYPRTLVSAYRMDDQRPPVAPQHLYFYSLAGSPMESEEDRRSRKARLRYHQAPVTAPSQYQYPPSMPMVIQSASTSPYEVHSHVPPSQPVLPPFSEVSQAWLSNSRIPFAESTQLPPIHIEQHAPLGSVIPSAPFANAGPPGVQFYSTLTPNPTPQYYRARGRQA